MHMMIVNYGCWTCRSKPCANSFAPMFFKRCFIAGCGICFCLFSIPPETHKGVCTYSGSLHYTLGFQNILGVTFFAISSIHVPIFCQFRTLLLRKVHCMAVYRASTIVSRPVVSRLRFLLNVEAIVVMSKSSHFFMQ